MSAISLERLSFDPANPADGPSIGSSIIGLSGNVAEVTAGNELLALVSAVDLDIRDLAFSTDKVDVTGSDITAVVSATDFDIRDLSFATDSVDVSGSSITATVSGTDIDIRDLVFATDKVDVTGSLVDAAQSGTWTVQSVQSGTWNVNLTDDSVADDAADVGNPFKVGGHAYDAAIGLSAVTAGDRANLGMDLYRQLLINDACNVGFASEAATVTAIAAPLPVSSLAGRKRVIIQNNSDASVYLGDASVTTLTGLILGKGSSIELPVGEVIAMYAVVASGSKNVRVLSLA